MRRQLVPRSAARRGLLAAIAILLAVNTGVLYVHSRDRTHSLSTAEALRRFREQPSVPSGELPAPSGATPIPSAASGNAPASTTTAPARAIRTASPGAVSTASTIPGRTGGPGVKAPVFGVSY